MCAPVNLSLHFCLCSAYPRDDEGKDRYWQAKGKALAAQVEQENSACLFFDNRVALVFLSRFFSLSLISSCCLSFLSFCSLFLLLALWSVLFRLT